MGRKDGGCRHSVGETGEEAFASVTPKSSTCVSIFSPDCDLPWSVPNSSLRPSPSPRRASPPGRCSINAQLNGDGSLRRSSPGMTRRKQGGGRSGDPSEGLLGIQEGDCHTLWWRERCRQRLSTRVCQPQPLGTDKDVEEGENVRARFSPGPRMLGGTHGGARIARDGAKSGVFPPISEHLGPSISQTSPSPSGKWEDSLLPGHRDGEEGWERELGNCGAPACGHPRRVAPVHSGPGASAAGTPARCQPLPSPPLPVPSAPLPSPRLGVFWALGSRSAPGRPRLLAQPFASRRPALPGRRAEGRVGQ